MKMFKKLAGVLTAAAVAAMTTVCAFAAPSPTATTVLKTASDEVITNVTVSDADTTKAPEGAVSLKADIYDLYDSTKVAALETAAKAANAAVVATCDVTVYWVDANGAKVADYEGTAVVTINYKAQTGDLILHEKTDGTVETLKTTVVVGTSASGAVTSLSPFAIVRPASTASNTSTTTNGSSSSQVLGAGVNMTTYVIIIAGLAACAAVLGSVVILRKKH